jgi:cytochrome c553
MKKIVLLGMFLAVSSLIAKDGASLYKACASCHGAKGEKKALGKSAVIKGWSASKVEKSLKGYKAGKGGPMKGVMKGQVTRLSGADIKAVSKYISSL